MKINSANVTIMVTDMDKAVDFYLSLGLTLKQRWENHYAMVEAPGVVIGLHPATEGKTKEGTGGASIGFMIDDFSEVKALLDSHNITYETFDDKSGLYAGFADPWGNQLYFTKPRWE